MKSPVSNGHGLSLSYSLRLVRLRESVRALIVDPDDYVLLVRFDWDGLEPTGGFWAIPGGGIEAGESRLEAIQRELREEVGMVVDSLSPELWTKTALFPMPRGCFKSCAEMESRRHPSN